MFPHMGRLRMPLQRFRVLSRSVEYRKLFDEVIAPGLGWSSIVEKAFRSEGFDKRIAGWSRHGRMIADLVDYRLRAVLNGRTKREGNVSHAVFFNWWPNKKRPSPRHRFGFLSGASHDLSPPFFIRTSHRTIVNPLQHFSGPRRRGQ